MSHLRRELGMFVALIVIGGGLFLSNADFLSSDNVLNTARQIAMLGIFAVGLAFVIITGGIDLSVGSMIGLTGVLLAKLTIGGDDAWSLFGHPLVLSPWLAVPIVLAVIAGIGLLQGLLITRLDLQPFIVTLGGMLLLRGVSQTVVHGGNLSLSDSGIVALATGWPFFIFIAVALAGAYLLHFTVFGRYVYAIGGNRDAARYSGINVKRVETLTYVISATSAGIAGLCYAAYIKEMSQSVGVSYELYAIAAAVLGGCSLRGGEGTVLGVVIGTIIMRVIQNGINMFHIAYHDGRGRRMFWTLDTNWENIIIGGVILIAVILDQVTHLVQAGRRTRKVTGPPTQQPTGGLPAVPTAGGGGTV